MQLADERHNLALVAAFTRWRHFVLCLPLAQ